MKSTPIEYRNKTEPPIEPGWYYARAKSRPNLPIEPVCLERNAYSARLMVIALDQVIPVEPVFFDFFGPVRIVKEG